MRILSFAFCLLFIAPLCYAQTITTIAGNGLENLSGDGGPADSAALSYPTGVAVDTNGNVYIGDTYNHRIRIVNTAGTINTYAGSSGPSYAGDGGPATAARFAFPNGICIDTSGNLFIADESNSRIRVVNTRDTVFTFAGNGFPGYSGDGSAAIAANLSSPMCVAADNKGNIYIADGSNYRIRMVNASGIISTIAGNGTNGNTGNGGPADSAEMGMPISVAVDHKGNVYFCDFVNSVVRVINSAGIINGFAGNGTSGYSGDHGPATAAKLFGPAGLAIDSDGNVFISDGGNNVVRKVDTFGIITTYAGDGEQGFSGDGGLANAAELNNPYYLTIDKWNNLYIADNGNNRIRKVTPIPASIAALSVQSILNVYPNPSNGNVSIHSSSKAAAAHISIYNTQGQQVYSTTQNTSDIELSLSLPDGCYTLKYTTKNECRVQQLVIRR